MLPEDGYSKYMYLGQLSIGTQAVHYFEKGIAIMEKELSLNDDVELRRQISSALCSLTEMYMTDLWWVDALVKLTTGIVTNKMQNQGVKHIAIERYKWTQQMQKHCKHSRAFEYPNLDQMKQSNFSTTL